MTKTLTVRGHKLRTATTRRYVVVAIPRPVTAPGGRDVPARVIRRSDDLHTARTVARRHGVGTHGYAVVVDTHTGSEVGT